MGLYAYNSITIIGRLVNNPQERTSANGKTYVHFTIAVRRPNPREYKADFFHIVCWGVQKHRLLAYARKGAPLLVSGSMRCSWTESLPTGERIPHWSIVLREWSFIGPKDDIDETEQLIECLDEEEDGIHGSPTDRTKQLEPSLPT